MPDTSSAKPRKIALVVLGMHRSGTSAMTRLLSIAGAALPSVMMESAPDNPTGFWEPADVVNINDRLMARFDSAWDDVFAGALRPDAIMGARDLQEIAVRIIGQNYGEHDLIVLKDPRTAVLAPFWSAALKEAGYSPRFVIMVRNPLDVAASLADRNGFSREKALLLWSSYMIAAERDTRDEPRTFVSYDKLLSNWHDVLDKVQADLLVSLPRRTATAFVESDRFLQRSLRHHFDRDELEGQGRLWAPARNLYDWFTAATDGRALPNIAPDQVGEQLSELSSLVGPIIAELQIAIRELDGRLSGAEREAAVAREEKDSVQGQLEQALVREAQRSEQHDRTAKRLTDEAVRLHDEAARYREEIVSRDARIELLTGFESHVGDMATAAERSYGRIAELEHELQLLNTREQEQSLALNAIKAEAEGNGKQARGLVAALEELQGELSNARAAGEAASQALDLATRERADMRAAVAEAEARSAALTSTLEAAQLQVAHARAADEAAIQTLDLTTRERDAMRAAVAEAENQNVALMSMLDAVRLQVADREARAAQLDRTVLELQRVGADLATELKRTAAASSASETELRDLHRQRGAWSDEREALLRKQQHLEMMMDETRLAAALESRTLRRHLHEQTEAVQRLSEHYTALQMTHRAVTLSTSWRLTTPLRTLLHDRNGLATTLRNGLKALYWAATLQLPARLRRRREFFSAQAAAAAAAPAISLSGPETAETPFIVAAPVPAAMPAAASAPAPVSEAPRRAFAWSVAEDPSMPSEALGLYDRRPDDAVPREAQRGREFLERFELLSKSPHFGAAVRYLNAKASTVTRPDSGEHPKVSIVIPIYGQLAYTLNCLDSLLDHRSAASFEVLIGDDASPDESKDILPLVEGVRTIRHAQNGGFVLNCNWTAAAARGDYVVFLNNDTRVTPGWLDELMDGFALFPKAGLVGSKLFYPDGVLQEAGGIVWRDGSAWNYGREQDPNRPEFCYARQVDYISGASIALPRDLWEHLAGFDELYKPAYCEDLDLALRVRSIGREVWLQPLSRVIHYEGRTSGTDTSQGVKAYQVTNLRKVYDRWSSVLAVHRPNGEAPLLEKDRNVEKRALIIDVGTPTPDQDAGSVVTVSTLRIYQELGYKVTFLPRDNFLFDPVYTQNLQRMGVECIYAPYEIDFGEFMKRQARFFDIVQIFRPGVAEQCVPEIRRYNPNVPIIFHNVDLHYLRMERQAEVDNDPALRTAAAAMKTRELAIIRTIDCMIVISPVEQEILQRETPGVPIVVFPYMTEVVGTTIGFSPRRDVMFLGGFRHTPNADAAQWLVTEIWPRIAEALPEANLLIVGPEPPENVKAFANDRIDVTGMAPDLRPYFDRTRVFVAPIRYGAGVKGKVATAMAHGVPVVATSCAAEGMFLVNDRDLAVADDPDEIARYILKLYRDEQEWVRLSEAGVRFVREHNSDAVGRRIVLEAIETADAARSRAGVK